MRLSKSKINTFLQCPRKFKYIYIDNYIEPTNEYMELGLIVHKIAEDTAKELQKKMSTNNSITVEDISDAIERYTPKTEFDLTIHLESLFDFFSTIFIYNNYQIFSVEGDIYDDQLRLRGIVDIVLENPETHELIIIDYKTGKDKSIKEYRKELCIYKYLVEQKYDRHVSAAGIFFTKTNAYRVLNFVETPSKGAYITDEDYDATFELIDWIRYRISIEDFVPIKQYLCNYCYFKDQCDYDGGF